MDFAERQKLERSLALMVAVAKLIVGFWDQEHLMMTSPKRLENLSEMIRLTRERLEALTLKLWYPLPHLHKS